MVSTHRNWIIHFLAVTLLKIFFADVKENLVRLVDPGVFSGTLEFVLDVDAMP